MGVSKLKLVDRSTYTESRWRRKHSCVCYPQTSDSRSVYGLAVIRCAACYGSSAILPPRTQYIAIVYMIIHISLSYRATTSDASLELYRLQSYVLRLLICIQKPFGGKHGYSRLALVVQQEVSITTARCIYMHAGRYSLSDSFPSP